MPSNSEIKKMPKSSLVLRKCSHKFFFFFPLSHILRSHTRSHTRSHSCRNPHSRKGHVGEARVCLLWTISASPASLFNFPPFLKHQLLLNVVSVWWCDISCLICLSWCPQVVRPAVVRPPPLRPPPFSSRAVECDNGVCVLSVKRHYHTK